MNNKIKKIIESETGKLCPVSGLSKLSKPEWTDVRFGKGCWATFRLLGDRILLVIISGNLSNRNIKDLISFCDKIIKEVIVEDQGFAMLNDTSKLKYTTREVREYLTDYYGNLKNLSSLIFYGVSPLIKFSINLRKQIVIPKYDVEIVDNYTDAIRYTQKVLLEKSVDSNNAISDTLSFSSGNYHNIKDSSKIITDSEWQFQNGNFSLRFEVINGDILHGISAGRLEEKYIIPSLEIQKKAIQSLDLHGKPYYYILGLEDSKRISQKARREYVTAIVELNKEFSLCSFIFYGASRILQAGIQLAKPFMPFKVHIVSNLEDALALTVGYTSKKTISNFLNKKKNPIQPLSSDKRSGKYVNEILQHIEGINWEIGGNHNSIERDTSHPFSPVFDAIDLIKWELDDLLKERKQAEDEIKRQLLEKETILKEVHHRIKNNFASIGSLLNLQAQSVTNPEAQSALQDAIGRVKSIQVLYEKLLLTDDYQVTSVKEYLDNLIDDIISLFPGNLKLTAKTQIDDFQLDSKRLFPIGIIVNELLTNTMKYAFTGRDSGLIEITLKERNGDAILTILDDGNGLPEGFDLEEQKGFGLMLVDLYSQQLDGSFSIESNDGTKCALEFAI